MKGSSLTFLLDTSVIVKWFKDEENSDKARLILEWVRGEKVHLNLSTLVLTETIRGLKKASWSTEDIQTSLQMLNDIITLGKVDLVQVDEIVARNAQRLIIEYNLYSADSIHIASALLTAVDVFITADKHQQKKHVIEEMEKHDISSVLLSGLDENVLSLQNTSTHSVA